MTATPFVPVATDGWRVYIERRSTSGSVHAELLPLAGWLGTEAAVWIAGALRTRPADQRWQVLGLGQELTETESDLVEACAKADAERRELEAVLRHEAPATYRFLHSPRASLDPDASCALADLRWTYEEWAAAAGESEPLSLPSNLTRVEDGVAYCVRLLAP